MKPRFNSLNPEFDLGPITLMSDFFHHELFREINEKNVLLVQ